MSAPASSAYMAEPVGRQNLRYDVSRTEVPSKDDFYGIPRSNNRNARSVTDRTKGKGKGNPFNSKGTRNANPKDWDADQVIIPEFRINLGIKFYTVNNLGTEGMSNYPVRNHPAFFRSITPGNPIQYLHNQQVKMRINPSDLKI
jgi:hypothetical protein